MLDQTLDREDIALGIILDDPVLCMEFLRSTKDGSEDKSLWEDFKYRHYQRDILTDKNPNVSITGGRSIGKCQVCGDRVYTTEGYKKISQLVDKVFRVWAWDEKTDTYIMRRATCSYDRKTTIYKLTTEHGDHISCSTNHPIWTDKGWKFASELEVGDYVTRTIKLPHVIDTPTYSNYEMRFLGYTLFHHWQGRIYQNLSRIRYDMRSNAIRADLEEIYKHLEIFPWKRPTYRERVARGGYYDRHPITILLNHMNMYWIRTRRFRAQDGLPDQFLRLQEDNLANFLGAIFAQYAQVTLQEVSLVVPSSILAKQIRDMLLRFGVETTIERTETSVNDSVNYTNAKLRTVEYKDVYNLIKNLPMMGYKIGTIKEPINIGISANYRYSRIVEKKKSFDKVYRLYVDKSHTYISNNMIVHNSYVLEDMILFDVLNNRTNLHKTPELLLATANQAQLTPILDRIIMRFQASPLLQGYVSGGLNRQKGVVDWKVEGRDIRMYARIVGSKSENNLIGLHLPRIRIDEGQVFSLPAYRQVQPVLNKWEKNIQTLMAGVPNGLTNSALYYADQRSSTFKRYRIPAPNNPFFTEADYNAAIKDYGGIESDLFQQLVLGKWGKGSEQVITQDDIAQHKQEFYNARYTSEDKARGISYKEKLQKPDLAMYDLLYTGIDTGFVDPTIIQIFGLRQGRWELVARYRLLRIEFPEQEQIINWLDDTYHFGKIAIDLGSGGNAPAIIQSLMSRAEYKSKQYDKRILGVMFNEHTVLGYDEKGIEIKGDIKTAAAKELVQFLQGKQIALSEVDSEGLSELERIARQRGISGNDKYFILSENGKGQARADHIFSSFLTFAWAIRDMTYIKNKRKKLGRTTG